MEDSTPHASTPDAEEPRSAPSESFNRLLKDLPEILQYLKEYLFTQWDLTKAEVRVVFEYILFSTFSFGLIIGIAIMGFACLFYGCSLGLGELLGNRPWLGFLLTGLGSLLLLIGVSVILLKTFREKRLKKRKQEYAEQIDAQRRQFGQSMAERAFFSGKG